MCGLKPIMALWIAPNKLFSSLGALRRRHPGSEDGIARKGTEDEMDRVVKLASTYLRVAALGLPAFGVSEVAKYGFLIGWSGADLCFVCV